MLCESAEATDTGKLFILGVAGIWRVKARKAKTIAQLMARPWPDGPVGQFHAETVQDPGELPRSKEDQTLLLRRSAPFPAPLEAEGCSLACREAFFPETPGIILGHPLYPPSPP